MMPLWSPENDTPDSSIFKVRTGFTAILIATGFSRFRTNTDAKEFRSPHLACLHRLILSDGTIPVGALEPCSACDYIYDISPAIVVTDEVARHSGCLMSVGGCDTIGVLPIPGIYYLHLNDATSIGTAQVWIEMYQNDSLPLPLLERYVL